VVLFSLFRQRCFSEPFDNIRTDESVDLGIYFQHGFVFTHEEFQNFNFNFSRRRLIQSVTTRGNNKRSFFFYNLSVFRSVMRWKKICNWTLPLLSERKWRQD